MRVSSRCWTIDDQSGNHDDDGMRNAPVGTSTSYHQGISSVDTKRLAVSSVKGRQHLGASSVRAVAAVANHGRDVCSPPRKEKLLTNGLSWTRDTHIFDSFPADFQRGCGELPASVPRDRLSRVLVPPTLLADMPNGEVERNEALPTFQRPHKVRTDGHSRTEQDASSFVHRVACIPADSSVFPSISFRHFPSSGTSTSQTLSEAQNVVTLLVKWMTEREVGLMPSSCARVTPKAEGIPLPEPCVVRVFIPVDQLRYATVSDVKAELEYQLGIPVELQDIICSGVPLQDELCVAMIDVSKVLVLKLRTAPRVEPHVSKSYGRMLRSPSPPHLAQGWSEDAYREKVTLSSPSPTRETPPYVMSVADQIRRLERVVSDDVSPIGMPPYPDSSLWKSPNNSHDDLCLPWPCEPRVASEGASTSFPQHTKAGERNFASIPSIDCQRCRIGAPVEGDIMGFVDTSPPPRLLPQDEGRRISSDAQLALREKSRQMSQYSLDQLEQTDLTISQAEDQLRAAKGVLRYSSEQRRRYHMAAGEDRAVGRSSPDAGGHRVFAPAELMTRETRHISSQQPKLYSDTVQPPFSSSFPRRSSIIAPVSHNGYILDIHGSSGSDRSTSSFGSSRGWGETPQNPWEAPESSAPMTFSPSATAGARGPSVREASLPPRPDLNDRVTRPEAVQHVGSKSLASRGPVPYAGVTPPSASTLRISMQPEPIVTTGGETYDDAGGGVDINALSDMDTM